MPTGTEIFYLRRWTGSWHLDKTTVSDTRLRHRTYCICGRLIINSYSMAVVDIRAGEFGYQVFPPLDFFR
jgi:hypothetical protein